MLQGTCMAQAATAVFGGFQTKTKTVILTIRKATSTEKYHCLSSISFPCDGLFMADKDVFPF